jgi:dihydroxyacetone kinase DhaKLM complex PTS-EIIA-like component DhaM
MDHVKVEVMLVVHSANVADGAHEMVQEITEIEETFVPHVKCVPNKVSTHVAE